MKIVSVFLNSLCALILIDVVWSWIDPGTTSFPRSITAPLTGPLYAPVHALLDPAATAGLDLAPLVWLVALQYAERTLRKRHYKDNPR